MHISSKYYSKHPRQKMTIMIKQIKKKLTNRHQESNNKSSINGRPKPLTPSEEFFHRKGKTSNPHIILSDKGSDPPSTNFESNSTESSMGDKQCGIKVLIVFIPDGFEPGQKVKVNYPDGNKARTVIPPRSKWGFKNCNGEPRPFFITNNNPSNVPSSREKTSAKRDQEYSLTSRKKVHFNDRFVCQCSPSLGVFDSICPHHGSVSRQS
mmetsp:Transcript_38080/g.80183  ORF Transcript_38080/g.80183 Transcript_38080/m.80183 type:complete len:209 (-) Transcript_38080:69-695(-)